MICQQMRAQRKVVIEPWGKHTFVFYSLHAASRMEKVTLVPRQLAGNHAGRIKNVSWLQMESHD